ncbi:MAG: protein phosphatase 2C domain-containing protein [Polyangiaceae bacterium]
MAHHFPPGMEQSVAALEAAIWPQLQPLGVTELRFVVLGTSARAEFYVGSRALAQSASYSTAEPRMMPRMPFTRGAPLRGGTALFEYCAGTTLGSCREVNEDAFAVFARQNALVVVDGCGGVSSGASAAWLAVAQIERVLAGESDADAGPADADVLARAVLSANTVVLHDGQQHRERRGQGATLCAVRIMPGWVAVAHVGDCRVGRHRGSEFSWLTQDHSLAAEMQKSGAPEEQIEQAQRDHSTVVTRAVGVGESLAVDVSYHPTREGDVFLLCSDGLARHVAHARVSSLIAEDSGLTARCDALLAASEAAGGWDNATVILARVLR